jgi:hypothetical protein
LGLAFLIQLLEFQSLNPIDVFVFFVGRAQTVDLEQQQVVLLLEVAVLGL